LAVYNLLGQRVRLLAEGLQLAGYHQPVWAGQDDHGQPVASGIYFCRLESQGRVESRRLLLLK
jgi:flagellar hook assembly protein FlgD